MNCTHLLKEIFRQEFENGLGRHVIERCMACRVNVRGKGVWVPHAEVLLRGRKPEDLKPDPWRSEYGVDPGQMGLFGRTGSGE